MIATSTGMIFASTVFSLALGLISGIIYAMVICAFSALAVALRKWIKAGKTASILLDVFRHMYDFVSVVLVGLILLIILYASCDGVVNIYPLVAVFLGFVVGKSLVFVIFRKKGGK